MFICQISVEDPKDLHISSPQAKKRCGDTVDFIRSSIQFHDPTEPGEQASHEKLQLDLKYP